MLSSLHGLEERGPKVAFTLKTTQEATHGLGPLSDVIQGVCVWAGGGGVAPRAEVLKSKEPLIKPRRGAGQKGQRAQAPVKVRPALPRALWSVA